MKFFPLILTLPFLAPIIIAHLEIHRLKRDVERLEKDNRVMSDGIIVFMRNTEETQKYNRQTIDSLIKLVKP